MHLPPANQWGSNAQKAQTHQPDWSGYVVTKVRHVRAAVLAGIETFLDDGFTVPLATGFIELTGMRAGGFRTFLKIGFADSSKLLLPTFQLLGNVAVGTIVMPSHSFTAALQLSNSPMAHFRIGGDGRRNAIATDIPLLHNAMGAASEPSMDVGFVNVNG